MDGAGFFLGSHRPRYARCLSLARAQRGAAVYDPVQLKLLVVGWAERYMSEIKPGAVQLIAALNFILSHPLNRGRPLSALGRFAAWQIASRLHSEIEFEW